MVGSMQLSLIASHLEKKPDAGRGYSSSITHDLFTRSKSTRIAIAYRWDRLKRTRNQTDRSTIPTVNSSECLYTHLTLLYSVSWRGVIRNEVLLLVSKYSREFCLSAILIAKFFYVFRQLLLLLKFKNLLSAL